MKLILIHRESSLREPDTAGTRQPALKENNYMPQSLPTDNRAEGWGDHPRKKDTAANFFHWRAPGGFLFY